MAAAITARPHKCSRESRLAAFVGAVASLALGAVGDVRPAAAQFDVNNPQWVNVPRGKPPPTAS
jgi:hypothetical protein